MIQLILHLVGDYVTQSDWMAQNKTKAFWPAFVHALVYSLPFAVIASEAAWWVIFVTHFFIDRYRLALYLVYAKNRLFDWNWLMCGDEAFLAIDAHFGDDKEAKRQLANIKRWKWTNCCVTGYPSDMPPWLATWLLIAADNTLHLAINAAALTWL